MTKIAITGPVSGTGTYTLNAPDTNDTLDFELPITGTHLASAQADGMPLGQDGDPVVESGSNSDGFWTRWADGTQVVSGKVTAGNISVTTSLGASLFQSNNLTLPYPVPFVEVYKQEVKKMSSTGAHLNAFGASLLNTSVSNFSYRIVSADSDTYTGLEVGIFAIGRWK